MTTELLKKLKQLQRVRGDASPFSSPLEYETWTDDVAPLLSFNEKLQNSFKYDVRIAKSKSRTESPNIDQINETIGILNQAVTLLEINPVHNPTANPTNAKPPSSRENQNPINIWNRPIGATWLIVVGGSIVLMVGYIFRHYFGITL